MVTMRIRVVSISFRIVTVCFRTGTVWFRTATVWFRTVSVRFRTVTDWFRTVTVWFRTVTMPFRAMTVWFREVTVRFRSMTIFLGATNTVINTGSGRARLERLRYHDLVNKLGAVAQSWSSSKRAPAFTHVQIRTQVTMRWRGTEWKPLNTHV